MELKEQVKLLTGNTNEDLISLILEKAKAEIADYAKQDYNTRFDNLAVDIAVIKINRLGSEGLSSQGYSGVTENYLDGYPQDILNRLNNIKKRWGMV